MVVHCCKTKLKKKIFFSQKYLCFLQKIYYLQKENVFMWEKIIMKIFFTEKKFFYREKYK